MIFISFRGEIRYGFVSHVCDAFRKEKIPFIIDEEFRRGRYIKKEIEKEIEKAEVLIPIISRNYATSIWCLDELVMIVKYHETKCILPVLYHVNLEDVISQKGCFEKAFDDLGKTHTEKEVNIWRIAFTKIAQFTPLLVQIDRHESEVVQNITRDVCKMLNRVCSLDTKGPHDATMNIRAAPYQISSQHGIGIPFGNEYPKEKIPSRMMTPAEMNSEVGLFIKEEVSRMAHSKRNFLESHVADEEEELLSLFNEMKYSSSSEDDEQDVDGHRLPKVPVPSLSMLVEIRTSLKTVIHGFSLGASVLQDAGMLAKLKGSLSYLSQLGPCYGFHFREKVIIDGLKEMLEQQEAELMAADNILDEAFSYHDFKEKASECLKEQYCHLQELCSEKMAQEEAESHLKEQQQALENQVSVIEPELQAARTSNVRLEHEMNLCRGAAAMQKDKMKRCIYQLKELQPALDEVENSEADVELTMERLKNQIELLSFLLKPHDH
ncbi:hypothetical protein K2173_009894 [Erythroxylum novogranatense]|uniref:TIR domain-containing protein n=1 Tax=Erythroxylum novogranatense TaxID=1862640 RepID=A0AAV8SZQ1_9ROSI|nr:hypothetical protein K2173_009894 [Erythroxylum novogranatense]